MTDTPEKETPSQRFSWHEYRKTLSLKGFLRHALPDFLKEHFPDLEKKMQEDQKKGSTDTAARPTITPPPPAQSSTARPTYSTGTPNRTTGTSASSTADLLAFASAQAVEASTGDELHGALESFGFTGNIEQAFDALCYNQGDYLSDGKVVLYKPGFQHDLVDFVARTKTDDAGRSVSDREMRTIFENAEHRSEESQVVGISPCVKYAPSDATYCTLINDEGLITIINGYTLFNVLGMAIDINNTALFTDSPIAPETSYLLTPITMRDTTEGIYGGADLLAAFSPRSY